MRATFLLYYKMKKVGVGITTRFSMQVVEVGCVAFRGCFNVVQDVAVTCLTTGDRIGLVALLPLYTMHPGFSTVC